METKTEIKLSDWLFKPFDYIAGEKSLIYGLAVLIIQAALGALAQVHFDGVIDMHIGKDVPFYFYILEVLVSWLAIAIVLYIAAIILSKSRVRAIDIFGTQALARWPMVIAALAGIPAPNADIEAYLNWRFLGEGQEVVISTGYWVLFFLFIIVDLLMIILMIALMFNAYRISANLKGAKAVVSFIVGLLLAEIISKLAISALFNNLIQ